MAPVIRVAVSHGPWSHAAAGRFTPPGSNAAALDPDLSAFDRVIRIDRLAVHLGARLVEDADRQSSVLDAALGAQALREILAVGDGVRRRGKLEASPVAGGNAILQIEIICLHRDHFGLFMFESKARRIALTSIKAASGENAAASGGGARVFPFPGITGREYFRFGAEACWKSCSLA